MNLSLYLPTYLTTYLSTYLPTHLYTTPGGKNSENDKEKVLVNDNFEGTSIYTKKWKVSVHWDLTNKQTNKQTSKRNNLSKQQPHP